MEVSTKHPRRAVMASGAVLCVLSATASAGELVGRVSDASGVKSLRSAEIEIVELGRRTQSGPDGRFRFADVPNGHFVLRANYVGADPVELPIDIAGDTATEANIQIGAVDEILVVGQFANQAGALSRQRAADGVQSVLTRDGIGQFPDQNVAESLRRVPGMSVQNDQGEGRFIVLRGLDPRLNAVSVNGARVPSPESDNRSMPLDTISSDQIESIEIKKTLTPDMDGDTIGGSVEINTTSAFDRKGRFFGATVEGSYNEQTDQWSPKASVNFSDVYGGRLGLAAGLSYYDRRFGSEGVEASGWDVNDDGLAYADEFDFRNYDVTRKRISGSLSLDYRASQNTDLYLRGLVSSFEDQEYRSRLVLGFDEAPGAGDDGSATFSSDDGEIKAEREMKDRKETQDVYSIVAGGKTYRGPWTLDYLASSSRAEEKEPSALYSNFARSFEDAGEMAITMRGLDGLRPGFVVSDAALFNDAAEYEFDTFELNHGKSVDREHSLRFDLARDFNLDAGAAQLKFGGKLRSRDKSYDLRLYAYDDVVEGDKPTLAGLATSVDYALAGINPTVSHSATRGYFNANRANLVLNEADSAFDSNSSDYKVGEDIVAGYVMGSFDARQWKLVGGVRVEHTRDDIRGKLVERSEDDEVSVTAQARDRRYTDVLPSLNLRFDASDEMVLRAGVYRSLVRPNLADLAPRFLVAENDEAELGNPDLDPYKAWNYDLSAEWYFGRNAVLQVGPFYKRIDDFIVTTYASDTVYDGTPVDELSRPDNGGQATVFGVELNYQQALDFLPAPFDGVLVGANYTYVDSEGRFNTEDGQRKIALPGTSKTVYNAMLGYEKHGFSLRLAATHRSEYLDEVSPGADEDRWVLSHLQYDLTARYRVTPQLQIFAEGINLGDEPFRAVYRGTAAGGDRLSQFEEYSWTAKAGLRFSFAAEGQ
jgi:TonB-dependent receptor